MQKGICPKCDAKEVYLSTTETHGVQIRTTWTDIVFTELYICADCGFLEFYVQHKTDLENVRKKFKKVKVK